MGRQTLTHPCVSTYLSNTVGGHCPSSARRILVTGFLVSGGTVTRSIPVTAEHPQTQQDPQDPEGQQDIIRPHRSASEAHN